MTRTGSGSAASRVASAAGSVCQALGPIPTRVATSGRVSASSRPVHRRADRREVPAQAGGDPVGLVRVHPQQVERVHQLGEVVGVGRDHQQRAGRVEHPVELRAVARGEDVEQHGGRGVRERQSLPGVGERGGGPGMRAGRAAQRRLGHVQGQTRRRPAAPPAPRRGSRPVPAPASTTRGYASTSGIARVPTGGFRRGGGEGGRDEVVVPGGEEVRPGGDHLGAVADVRGAPGEQVDVPLAGDVEAVPARAAQRTGGAGGRLGQRLAADRAAQPVEDAGVHVRPPLRAAAGRLGGPARRGGRPPGG